MKQNKPEKSELRSFGLSVGGLLLILTVWPGLLQPATRIGTGSIAGLLILPALLKPIMLELPYRCWMMFGGALGWLNTRIILTLLYFFAVFPTGLLLKLTGRTPLKLYFDADCNSYREPPEKDSQGKFTEQF